MDTTGDNQSVSIPTTTTEYPDSSIENKLVTCRDSIKLQRIVPEEVGMQIF